MRPVVFLLGLCVLACSGRIGATPDVPPAPTPAPSPGPVLPDARPTNFLVIVADDLGTDKVAAYREHASPPKTPAIDGLAAAGVLFRNAYVYPTCSASRAALLSGRYGRRNGMGGIVDLDTTTFEMPLREVLIPEALARGEQKWATAAVGKWHLSGFLTPSAFSHPLKQGFDHHTGSIGNLVLTSKDYGKKGGYFRYERSVDGQPAWSHNYVTVETTDDAITELGRLTTPFFLWVAYNAPHDPFHPPPAELVGRRVSKESPVPELHAAMVESMDRQIARLLAAMTDGQRKNTMIVFIGDNGTAGDAILPPLDRRHGKGTLYEGGTNVPLIVAGAGVSAQGSESAALVHAVDLLPTVLELARVSADGLALDGVSFAGSIADPKAASARSYVYTERFSPIGKGPYDVDLVAVRDERYKLLRPRSGEWLFYDLQGRFDDGPAVPINSLKGPPRRHYDALEAEMSRLQRVLRFEY